MLASLRDCSLCKADSKEQSEGLRDSTLLTGLGCNQYNTSDLTFEPLGIAKKLFWSFLMISDVCVCVCV